MGKERNAPTRIIDTILGTRSGLAFPKAMWL